MANKLPKYLSEIIPYSRLVRKKDGFRQSVSSYMERSKILIGDAYDVDYDRVVSIFLKAWDKSEKDYPSPSVITPQNIAEFTTFNEYCLYLWEYYVENKKEPPKPKAPPKVPEQKKPEPPKPKTPSDQEPPQVTSEGEFEGYGDDDDLLSIPSTKPKKKPSTSLTIYEGVKEDDLIGDEEIDERILRMIGLDVIEDIDYATYISLLKEWSIAARMKGAKISTEEAELIANEFKRVKRKVGRFRINQKKVNIGSDPAAPSPVKAAKNFITGSPEPEQKLLPPAEGPKKKRKKRKASLEENVAAIRKNVEAIQKILEDSLKQKMKAIGANRKAFERDKRENRENKLEGAVKKAMSAARKVLAPVFDVLGRIMDFLKTIILGRILYKLIEWLGNPENQGKLNSVIQFVKDWWPALLAGFLLFATPLGLLVRTVMGTIAKLTLTMLKRGIPMLLRFIAKNPLAAAAIGTGIAAGVMAFRAKDSTEQQLEDKGLSDAPPKQQADELSKPGSIMETFTRGILPSLNAPGLAGGGKVPRKSSLSGGRVTQSSGKRVRGGGKDTQMIVAQPGEVVISKKAVDKFGPQLFLDLNKAGGGTNVPKFMSGLQLAAEGGRVGVEFGGSIPTLDIIAAQEEQQKRFGLQERIKEVGADQALLEFRAFKMRERAATVAPTVRRNSNYAELSPELQYPMSQTPNSSNGSGSNLGSTFSGMKSSAVVAAPPTPEAPDQEEDMVAPTTLPASSFSAPFTGAVTEKPKAAPKPTPIQVIPFADREPPPEPPAGSKVSITQIQNSRGATGNSATNPGNDRDIPEFDTALTTSSRLMNMQIYGIVGVE